MGGKEAGMRKSTARIISGWAWKIARVIISSRRQCRTYFLLHSGVQISCTDNLIICRIEKCLSGALYLTPRPSILCTWAPLYREERQEELFLLLRWPTLSVLSHWELQEIHRTESIVWVLDLVSKISRFWNFKILPARYSGRQDMANLRWVGFWSSGTCR